MGSPERKTHNSIDFKSIGQKYQSDEVLTSTERHAFFSLGLEYATGLIESKRGVALYGYDGLSQSVKDYFAGVILRRIIVLYKEVDKNVKEGVKESESITRFSELDDFISKKLSVDSGKLSEGKMINLFSEETEAFLDEKLSTEVAQGMPFIRRVLTYIVADNPSKGSDREVYQLD